MHISFHISRLPTIRMATVMRVVPSCCPQMRATEGGDLFPYVRGVIDEEEKEGEGEQ